MSITKLDTFHVIGIAKRTSNEPGVGDKDFPEVWNRFMSEGIASKIPNKINDTIYAVYGEYEGDHTQPYTFLVGCKVTTVNEIPEGMTAMEIPSGSFNVRSVRGDVSKGVEITNAWMQIWNENLNRAYTADFEVYDERAMNPQDAEVDIYVSVH